MLNENAKKWVAALRSGEYKQTKNYLKNNEGFCCLGVLCDLYAKDAGVAWNGARFMGSFQTPPRVVLEWAALREPDGDHRAAGMHTSLTARNDNGCSFSKIADIIESEPEGLFVK